MNGYRLTWKERPPGWIDARPLQPERLARLSVREIARETLQCGSRLYAFGDVFHVGELPESVPLRLEVEGCARFLWLGASLRDGCLVVDGPAGACAGARMLGGELRVRGSVADLAAAGMQGGLLTVDGDSGSLLGGPLPGERLGMRGGEVIVHGAAGERAGLAQRGGLIAVGGEVGAQPGHHMRAGTIVVGRGEPDFPGVGMKRGTIISLQPGGAPPPTFRLDGPTDAVFLKVLARRLEEVGSSCAAPLADSRFVAYSGDCLCGGRGEVLYRSNT